jgi:hypothetical protein
MALVLGTAGMTHILMRFFTVPTAQEARKSVIWAMAIIGGFYVLTLFLGFGAAKLVGPAVIAGAGIGAYVALLLAGGRRAQVAAALLLPGRGLDGGGALPDFDRDVLTLVTPAASPALPPGCDPLCCALQMDARPPDYAAHFAGGARRLLMLEDGGARPPWWERARQAPAARPISGDVRSAFAQLAEAP